MSKSEAQPDEVEEKKTEEKKDEKPISPKISFITKYKMKMREKKENYSEKVKTKYPKMHEKVSGHLDEFK